MTAKDTANGVLGDIAAAGATAAWNIATVFLDGCKLTHAGANLQKFGNLEDGAGPLSASSSNPVSSRLPANAGVATTQSCRMLKKTRITLTMKAVKPILGQINAPRLPNWRYQKLQPPALTERRQSECPNLTKSSTAIAAT